MHNSPCRRPPNIVCPDGRIYVVSAAQLCRWPDYSPIRYACYIEVLQYSEPRDFLDFNIFLYRDLFEMGETDDYKKAAMQYAVGQVTVWLDKNPLRIAWSTETVELHCSCRAQEVFIP